MRSDQKDIRVRLRPETRRKWDRIAGCQRWTYTETADALADEFLARHGFEPEGASVAASNGDSTQSESASPTLPGETDHPAADGQRLDIDEAQSAASPAEPTAA